MVEHLIGQPCSFTLSGADRHGVVERVGHSEALGVVMVVMCDDRGARATIDRCVLSGETADRALASIPVAV